MAPQIARRNRVHGAAPYSVDDRDVYDFLDNVSYYLMNRLNQAIIAVDKATRDMGEEGVKEAIMHGVQATRQVLDQISRQMPQDERSRIEYAKRFLEAKRRSLNGGAPPDMRHRMHLVFDSGEMEGGLYGNDGIEGAVSPLQMHRVGLKFGALGVPYTEEDLVNALGWARMVISDVQNVLLKVDDGDVEELAQITIICLRILIGYAKSTGRTLALLLAPTQARAVQDTDGSGDNGAGPRLAGRQDQFWQNAFLPEVGVAGGSAEDNRVLPWGPLSPWLLQEAQRFAAESKERPLKAAAIAAAVLPFSGAVLFFGTPVVAGDAVLQWGASTSVGRTVAQGTQNAVELGKLGWITSKLATKQTLRLASQELDRIGGVPGLACQAKDGALWTAGHPIEATMMGTGLAIDLGRAVYRQTVWAGGLVNDMWGSFCDEVCSGSVEEYGAE